MWYSIKERNLGVPMHQTQKWSGYLLQYQKSIWTASTPDKQTISYHPDVMVIQFDNDLSVHYSTERTCRLPLLQINKLSYLLSCNSLSSISYLYRPIVYGLLSTGFCLQKYALPSQFFLERICCNITSFYKKVLF